jgi:hypothetical protein
MTDVSGTPFERRFSNLPTNGSFFLPPKQIIRVRVWSSSYSNILWQRKTLYLLRCKDEHSAREEKRREEREFSVLFTIRDTSSLNVCFHVCLFVAIP